MSPGDNQTMETHASLRQDGGQASDRLRAHGSAEVLRPSEERQTFLLRFSDALRPLSDPGEVQATASRLLGEHLGVDRADYVEIDEANRECVVARDGRRPGAPSHAHRYPLVDWAMPWLLDRKTWVMGDVNADPVLPDEQRDSFRASDIGAAVVAPLIKADRLAATLVVHQRMPRSWSRDEVALIEETAERTWAAAERARADEARRESEERYRALFNSSDYGFCTIEVAFDEDERAVDYRFLEVSPSFEQQTGIPNAAGRMMREIAPDHDDRWFEIYGRVALTGQPERFEHSSKPLGRWWNVYAFRIREPHRRHVAILFTDITKRKRQEANVAFLNEVTMDLMHLTSIEETMGALCARIGAYFGAWRCGFVETNEVAGEGTIRHTWVKEGRADTGAAHVNPLREVVTDEFYNAPRAGEMMIVRDTRADPRTHTDACDEREIRAFLAAPYVRNGEWRASLSIADFVPRDWRDDEIEMMRELTTRIWSRLERARAEDALRHNEERLRRMVNIHGVGVLTFNASGTLIHANDAFLELTGYSHDEVAAQALHWRALTPVEHVEASERQMETLASAGQIGPYEKKYVKKDGTHSWMLVTGAGIGDGAIVEYAIDINDRKKAEAALRHLEERSRQTNEALALALLHLDERAEGRTRELTAMADDRQNLIRLLVLAQEQERARVSRELHDQMGQRLTGLLLGADALRAVLPPGSEMAAQAERLREFAADLSRDVHQMAWDLRPPALDDLGLAATLSSYVEEWGRRQGIDVDIHSTNVDWERRLPPAVETVYYRIMQEALSNVARHALGASRVSVVLERQNGHAHLVIEDDGPGFDVEVTLAESDRLGLRGMRERAAVLGGTLEIESAPGSGTTLFVRVPVSEA